MNETFDNQTTHFFFLNGSNMFLSFSLNCALHNHLFATQQIHNKIKNLKLLNCSTFLYGETHTQFFQLGIYFFWFVICPFFCKDKPSPTDTSTVDFLTKALTSQDGKVGINFTWKKNAVVYDENIWVFP